MEKCLIRMGFAEKYEVLNNPLGIPVRLSNSFKNSNNKKEFLGKKRIDVITRVRGLIGDTPSWEHKYKPFIERNLDKIIYIEGEDGSSHMLRINQKEAGYAILVMRRNNTMCIKAVESEKVITIGD